MKQITLSPTADTPIYQQLYEQIVQQIFSGDLASTTPLPSIRTTAKELRIAIITVKKAWEELERDGYIYTIAGKGTFISECTQNQLEERKHQLLKNKLSTVISYYKDLGIPKEMIIQLLHDVYKK